ncbi:hypothetical protein [Methylobacterium sp. SD21]|uniref:hypothetical protein n=1 Tax=Methylobacterium litchii TaxID=3138810 RepID=UPI00313C10C7
MYFVTEYKVDALLDANKRKQVDFSNTSALGDMVQVASIPNAMYWDWHKQGILDDEAAFARKLNDSSLQHIRTNNLRV